MPTTVVKGFKVLIKLWSQQYAPEKGIATAESQIKVTQQRLKGPKTKW